MDACINNPVKDRIGTYDGKPCRNTEMTVGNTLFTVISVQGESAKETACDKVKKLIMDSLKSA